MPPANPPQPAQIIVCVAAHSPNAARAQLRVSVSNATVLTAKAKAVEYYEDPSLYAARAIHAGTCHSDATALSDIRAAGPDAVNEPLFLVALPARAASFLPADGERDPVSWLHTVAGTPPGVSACAEQGDGSLRAAGAVMHYFVASLANSRPAPACDSGKDDVQQKTAYCAWHPGRDELRALRGATLKFAPATDVKPANGGARCIAFELYACAVVVPTNHATAFLHLVALDQWGFNPHAGATGVVRHHSTAMHYAVLLVGSVPLRLLESVLHKAGDLLGGNAANSPDEEDEKDAEDVKSGVHVNTSHHSARLRSNQPKTAETVRVALQLAISIILGNKQGDEVDMSVPEAMGFTEPIPSASGSSPRNVAFPLASAVISYELECGAHFDLHTRLLAQLILALSEAAVADLCAQRRDDAIRVEMDTFVQTVDSVIHALRKAHCISAHLVRTPALKTEMHAFAARVISIRAALVEEDISRAEMQAIKFRIPSLPDPVERMRDVKVGALPAKGSGSREKRSLDTAWSLTKKNKVHFLSSVQLEESPTWEALLSWMTDAEANSFEHSLQICNIAEIIVFGMVREGFHDDVVDVKTVESAVHKYRTNLNHVVNHQRGMHMSLVELRSKEILFCWAGYCAIHNAIVHSEPMVDEYDVPLNPNVMQFLVLSNEPARKAVKAVAQYLKEKQQHGDPIFSLLPDDATVHFARRYAMGNEDMVEKWKVESEEATGAMKRRWAIVLEKKKKLATMDLELSKVVKALNDLESTMQATKRNEFPTRRAFMTSMKNHRATRAKLMSEISEKRSSCHAIQYPPAPILQPFPRTQYDAMPVLFFLWMPESLEILSRMTFSAQQLLLPKNSNWTLHLGPRNREREWLDNVDEPEVTWYSYYAELSSRTLHEPRRSSVLLGSSTTAVSGNWYPKSVRDHKSPEDGVYYPDSLTQELFWAGGQTEIFPLDNRNGTYLNPFQRLDERSYAHFFTEPTHNSGLKWALYQYTGKTSDCRSNEGISSQGATPFGMTPTQYMDFTALRAYPRQQFRTLCCLLDSESLPLDDPDVAILFRQTLFQIGKIFIGDDVSYAWFDDADRFGGWRHLHSILSAHSERIKFKVREHPSMSVLAPVASFAAQFDKDCANIARRFANIARSWADELEDNERNCEADKIAEIRTRRCLFYLYAITCYDFDITFEDAEQLIELILLVNYLKLFEEETNMTLIVQKLYVKAFGIICRCESNLLAAVNEKPSILTLALKKIIASTPQKLNWKPYFLGEKKRYDMLTSFTAVHGTLHVFFVDIFSGTVLLDGKPLSRLPPSVTNDRMFKQAFGDRNFEVIESSNGSFQTARAADGFFYSFTPLEPKGVRIIEKPRATSPSGDCLELLPHMTRDAYAAHAGEIPFRLQTLFSHWYCRTKKVIVCRSFPFNERHVKFILVQGKTRDSLWKVYQVPPHIASLSWKKLADSKRRLGSIAVTDDSGLRRAIEVLGKFESTPGCIELFRRTNGTSAVHLPRFGMEFEIEYDGSLRLTSYDGFRLSKKQLFSNTLRDFTSYLIIEREEQMKILIPAGSIRRGPSNVYVAEVTACSTERSVHVYDVHKTFGCFDVQAGKKAIEGRLQLAAVYAATDSLLPDRRFSRTSGESAIQLLRQCWSSLPFSELELGHMRTITRYGWRCPSLQLLCLELVKSANSLKLSARKHLKLALDDGASIRYSKAKRNGELSPNMLLTQDEERVLFGCAIAQLHDSTKVLPKMNICNDLVSSNVKEEIKSVLDVMLKWIDPPSHFDMATHAGESSQQSKLEKRIYRELQESRNAHSSLQVPSLSIHIDAVQDSFQELQAKCKREIMETLSFVQDSLVRLPTSDFYSYSFGVQRALNIQPIANAMDVARCARDPDLMKHINPFLSQRAKETLKGHVMNWLSLCVIDAKIDRIIRFTQENSLQELILELKETGREWSPEERPEWLLLEVEQGIQIRKLQYKIAMYCMKNNKCSTQMNMGEGKTRVILPMIVSQMTNKEQLVRLNFLSPLLSEAYEYLHRTLTASLLPKRIMLLPFNRDVHLDSERANDIHIFMKRMQECEGLLCVAPEHVLSFQLKWHEMRLNDGEKSTNVGKIMKDIRSMKYYDIMDEIDELLHHKYQLIYAVGDCTPLPSGKERWIACQAVLQQVHENETVMELIRMSGNYTVRSDDDFGRFNELRLQTGNAFESSRHEILSEIAQGILNSPPHYLRHLKDIPNRNAVLKFIVKPECCLQWLFEELGAYHLPTVQKNMILSLRGFLAYGILELGLSKRHRVDYGVDERRGAKNRVAVPYRASDTPTERSEYAQPDTLIFLTHLTYYYRGISRAEVKEALKELMKLGPIAQNSEYLIWVSYAAANEEISDQDLSGVDNASKLDVQNEAQLEILHRIFRFNIYAINFWLDNCVLPRETMQFGERLSANAFNLAQNENGDIVGFSGTKDRKLLMPIQIQQLLPDIPELQATDGRMLQNAISNATVLELGVAKPLNRTVLELSIDEGFNALIDAGAAMAGLSNAEVANELIFLLNNKRNTEIQGVVYYCQNDATWKVRRLDGMEWNKGNSPIQEQNAMVYFDESRCRGADIKLRDDATGLLTIGPNMAKDKLMQAAGRLRKLDRGQRIVCAVPSELVPAVRAESEKVDCKSLLDWVIRNTAHSIADGLPEWASQGLHFASTRDPNARVMKEKVELCDLYGSPMSQKTIAKQVRDIKHAHVQRLKRLNLKMDQGSLAICRKIYERADEVASDWPALTVSLGEECEREVEAERELEREVTREVPSRLPCVDTGLGRIRLGPVRTMEGLRVRMPAILHISEAMRKHFSASGFNFIRWDATSLYVTENFIETVRTEGDEIENEDRDHDEFEEIDLMDIDDIAKEKEDLDLGDYMRPVGLVLIFPSEGSVLLLSEHEADDALQLGWKLTNSAARKVWWVLVHATALFRSGEGSMDKVATWTLRVPQGGRFEHPNCTVGLTEETMAGLQIFCGETMFGSAARVAAVKNLLESPDAKRAALVIVDARGKRHLLSRSELEDICNGLDS